MIVSVFRHWFISCVAILTVIATLGPISTAHTISGFGLSADFDVDGVRLHRELVNCQSVSKDGRTIQCHERIFFRDQLIEERVLIINETGVWLAAEINPIAREVEEYTPYIPLILFYETGTASGTYIRYDMRQTVQEEGMWSSQLLSLGYESSLPIRKYQSIVQFTSKDLKRYRNAEFIFWIATDGQLIRIDRRIQRQLVTVDQTTWIMVDKNGGYIDGR